MTRYLVGAEEVHEVRGASVGLSNFWMGARRSGCAVFAAQADAPTIDVPALAESVLLSPGEPTALLPVEVEP